MRVLGDRDFFALASVIACMGGIGGILGWGVGIACERMGQEVDVTQWGRVGAVAMACAAFAFVAVCSIS